MMNSDLLATYYTLFLLGIKIVLVSRAEPLEAIIYFIYGIWALIFWGNVRVIADAIAGKNISVAPCILVDTRSSGVRTQSCII